MPTNFINNNYGRKKGFIKSIVSSLYLYTGGYKVFLNINWNIVQRLVFICHGNICRSAYAQAYANHLGLLAASAGINAINLGKADPTAIEMASHRHIDLTLHRTTHIDNFERKDGDLFLCMEPEQGQFMLKVIGSEENINQQVTLLGLWADESWPFLQDPYGLTNQYWEKCLNIIDSGITRIYPRLSIATKGKC